jgi:hypothetical protein
MEVLDGEKFPTGMTVLSDAMAQIIIQSGATASEADAMMDHAKVVVTGLYDISSPQTRH